MKKAYSLAILLLVIIFGAFVLVSSNQASAKNDPKSGSIIKGKGISTLYYLGEDGKRYVFPSAKTYFSWFDDFTNITEVEDEDLYDYPLAGNVRYKPGVLLIKIQTDPKVYAVGNNGKLRWIKTEKIAKGLYGANWNLLIDDVPDSFFTNYTVSDPIDDEDEYDPDEEEENTPTIGHNLKHKIKKIIKRINRAKKVCVRLEKSINKIQKRLDKLGIKNIDIGSDFLNRCMASDDGDDDDDVLPNRGKKVTICHIPPGNPEDQKTISIGRAAARAHLAHGDSIGACEGEEPSDEDEEDDTTPPVISSISVEEGETTATITWTTNEDSDSTVEYADSNIDTASTTSVVSDDSMTTSHSIELDGLTASMTYYFIVKSSDAEDNEVTSSEMSFTTLDEEPEPEPDTTAPVISNIQTSIGSTTAAITWDTDEDSSSKLTYATESLNTASSTEEVADSTLTMSHSLELTDLATSTQYFFIVESEDAENNIATSTEDNFTTL